MTISTRAGLSYICKTSTIIQAFPEKKMQVECGQKDQRGKTGWLHPDSQLHSKS